MSKKESFHYSLHVYLEWIIELCFNFSVMLNYDNALEPCVYCVIFAVNIVEFSGIKCKNERKNSNEQFRW